MKALYNRYGEFLLLCGGLLFLAALLLLPTPRGVNTYVQTLQFASAVLRGDYVYVDILANLIGFRGMWYGTDPYPVLGPAFQQLGVYWNVQHAHTHPPTAYLLIAPLAFLEPQSAVAIWAWVMVILLGLSCYFMGFSAKASVGLAPLCLLWPPAAMSLGQTTAIWLLGFAIAYRRSDALAGVALGVAAMTKYFAGIMLLPLVKAREWRVLVAFGITVAIGVAAAAIVDSTVFHRYWEVNQTNSIHIILRADNASIVATAYRINGVTAVAAILLFLGLIWYLNRKRGRSESLLLYNYLSIALLPIVWIYSTLPLLPILVFFLLKRHIVTSSISGIAMVLLTIAPRWGTSSVPYIATGIMLTGLCFLADSWLRLRRARQSATARAAPDAPRGEVVLYDAV